MKLNDLKPPKRAKRRQKRVGRGEGSGYGKTCGRGHKGQNSRSGGGTPPWFEGGQTPFFRRFPKRGFKPPNRKEYDIVNVKSLNIFEDDTVVTPESLHEARLTHNIDKVKILGNGELEKKLTVRAHSFSKSAVAKIEAAGGKIFVLLAKAELRAKRRLRC